MRRREFIKVIGGAAAWPLAAHAQQAVSMRCIGILLDAKEDWVIIRPGSQRAGIAWLRSGRAESKRRHRRSGHRH
jgi:hypothetical protein